MFLDTMEPRTENKNLSLEKNIFDNVGIYMLNNCIMCPLNDIDKNNLYNSDLKGVNFCVTQFATRFTHVSRQYQTKNRK